MARDQDDKKPSRFPNKEFGPEAEAYCPHCRAPLISRKDYRDHLTLKTCQGNTQDFFRLKAEEDTPPDR
ncbi:MAG: hypothetical protein WA790_05195 [Sulfitobacter sp.]